MTPADLERIRASNGWRERRVEVFRDTSAGAVLVKGQRASQAQWRHFLMNGIARLTKLPMLAGSPEGFGVQAQRTEVTRLRALAAAGVPVPQLLHVDAEFIVMRFIPGAQLAELLRGDQAVVWWQRGLQFLADTHRRDQCLSQAFARNFIASGEQLVAIDFESDPRQAMSLDAAKARDWLAFLYSSMKTLPLPAERAAAILHAAQADEPEAVRRMVADAGHRMAWVRHLRGEGQKRSWRRHISNLQAVSAAILGAEAHASQRQAAHR